MLHRATLTATGKHRLDRAFPLVVCCDGMVTNAINTSITPAQRRTGTSSFCRALRSASISRNTKRAFLGKQRMWVMSNSSSASGERRRRVSPDVWSVGGGAGLHCSIFLLLSISSLAVCPVYHELVTTLDVLFMFLVHVID